MSHGKDSMEVGLRRAEAGEGSAPGRVLRAVLVFYAAATLLNGEALLREAELMRYGRMQELCVTLARPLASVNLATRQPEARAALEQTFYGED